MEHVADTISDWTNLEELKREAIQLKNLGPSESPEGTVACQHEFLVMRLCLAAHRHNICFFIGIDEKATDSADEEEEDEDTLEPVIRKDSLKVSTS